FGRAMLGECGGDVGRLVQIGEHATLFVVGEKHLDAEVFDERPERRWTHVFDHLKRRGVEGDELVARTPDFCGKTCCSARRVGEERPRTEKQIVAAIDDRFRQFLRQEKEVSAASRHHAALAGLVDEHRNAAREVCVGLDEVMYHSLALEVLAGEVAEAIAAISEPPADTRAYFRGRCIDTFPEQVVAANWDSLVFDVGSDALRRVPMMEPMRGTRAHVGTLFDECESAAELLRRLGT
ncbi:MAG: hypothetical protein EBY52_08985, partial [Actinobacteria bacterium]|nr:hypothetical protein [Actinomycetota bacterium]